MGDKGKTIQELIEEVVAEVMNDHHLSQRQTIILMMDALNTLLATAS